MSTFSNIKILLSNGQHLDYESGERLGIKLNRIVDDLTNPSKRYGDFSYTFSLPKTKNNSLVWEYPDAKGNTRIFQGKQFDCKVFNNNQLLLDGIIELTSFDSDSYKCLFFSKYTELLDAIKGKKLVDITSLPTIEYDYEQTVISHINSNLTSDQTDYQFIFSFYKPPFMSGATGQGNTSSLKAEDNFSYYYNYIVSDLNFGEKNSFSYGSFPPAIYLVSILKGMLNNAGWNLGGSFFDNADIRKIVIPFTGDPEDFSGSIITGTTTYLNLNKVLPDLNQVDFLNSLINAFNLYFTIDLNNRQINFETYNTLFADSYNPYDVTAKIDAATIQIIKPEPETRIIFDDDGNNALVGGFGRAFDYAVAVSGEPFPTHSMCLANVLRDTMSKPKLKTTYNKNAFENLWNKTSGTKDIKLSFSPPNYFPYTIINERSKTNVSYNSGKYPSPLFTVGVPLISEMTPQDNAGYTFAEDDQDYCSGNDPNNLVYDGGVKMYFYYGPAAYDYVVTGASGNDTYRNWAWIGITTGGTCSAPAMARVNIPIASPFKLMSNSEKSLLLQTIQYYGSEKTSEVGGEAQGLLLTYFSSGKLNDSHIPTSFSLTLGENPGFVMPNLYSYFHQKKYETLRNGYLLKANMVMNENDWREMQINRTLTYDRLNYQLVSIKNYNPVKNTAEVTLLKK